jgi:hypothetical protein
MKFQAILLNFILPGLGTMRLGKYRLGRIQVLVSLIAYLIIFTSSFVSQELAMVGFCISMTNLIWSIITVFQREQKPEKNIRKEEQI